jgi:toxin ParE1/3/4
MKVRFTSEAKADLLQIADHIAKDDPIRALSFISQLESKCMSLADNPNVYSLVP